MNNYGINTPYSMKQSHTHEFLGNAMISEATRDPHNHRLSGISSEAISAPGGHIHEIVGNTGFDNNHLHRFSLRSSLQIPVGDNRHIHLIKGVSTIDDGHSHNIEISTLI